MTYNFLTYIGYFYPDYDSHNSIVLCVSDEAWKCRYYCEKIRKLDRRQYEVREVLLDENSRYSLFEDFILEEFSEEYLFLTNQDILYLTKEVDTMLDHYQEIVKELKAYRSTIKHIPAFRHTLSDISKTIAHIDEQLSSVHNIRLLCSEMYRRSIVFSPSILEYLQGMKSLSYDRELNDLYTFRMSDPYA